MFKLKLDDNGNAVIADGKPVYVYPDGREVAQDVPTMAQRITNLEEEKDRHYKNYEEATEKLKEFENFDMEEAKKALETVKNLDPKVLEQAKDIDSLREQIAGQFDADKKNMETKFAEEKSAFEKEVDGLKGQIRELLILSEFEKSQYFSGENPKTNLPAKYAYQIFGKHFDIEGEGAEAIVFGKNAVSNQKILSSENYTSPAPFDEAIGIIIDSLPEKDSILRGKEGGPNANRDVTLDERGRRVLKASDPVTLGRNLEDIAAGKVKVVH